jgi:hypothetical protein
MIVFLTGPFGVGKTTVAQRLVELWPGAILFDPEKVGALVRDLLAPVEWVSDFQDYAVWRGLVIDVVRRLREEYDRPIIMPMTVWRRDYFDAMVGGLLQLDPTVLCVRLTVTRETLVSRILGRPDAEGGHDWCLAHLDVGMAAAANPHFGVGIATDGQSPERVARAILALLPNETHRRG